MAQVISNRPRPAAAAALVLVLSLALAACGGSSTSTSTNASASATGTGASGAGQRGGRFKALRECLQKNGIALPQRTPGQGPRGGGGLLGGGGGPQLPKGVTRAEFEAAVKKCGGLGGARGLGGQSRFNSPAFKQALAQFASCMRDNGVNVPEPNTSGSGPIFNTKGLNTGSAQFKTAEGKCRSKLPGAFGRRAARTPGAGGPAGAKAPGV
jgi:hypothetical protein